MSAAPLKPVVWLGDSLRELRSFPGAVQDEMGYAILRGSESEHRNLELKRIAVRSPGRGCGRQLLQLLLRDTEREVDDLALPDVVRPAQRFDDGFDLAAAGGAEHVGGDIAEYEDVVSAVVEPRGIDLRLRREPAPPHFLKVISRGRATSASADT